MYASSRCSSSAGSRRVRRPEWRGWTVFAGNLHKRVSRRALLSAFSRYGYVTGCWLYQHNLDPSAVPGRGLRYGIVEYERESAANAAVVHLNGTKMAGLRIYVGAHQRRAANDRAPSNDVFLTCFGELYTEDVLWERCSVYGPIESLQLKRHAYGYRFAIVRYADMMSAHLAIRRMNQVVLPGGRRLHATRAHHNRYSGPVCPRYFRALQQARTVGYNIEISGLDRAVNNRALRRMFQVYGDIVRAAVGREGRGVVRFADRDAVKWAVACCDGAVKDGMLLRITVPATNDIDIQVAIPGQYPECYVLWKTVRIIPKNFPGSYVNFPEEYNGIW